MKGASHIRPIQAIRASALLRIGPRPSPRFWALPRANFINGNQPLKRPFSIGPTLVESTQTFILSVHSLTHLPWFLCLPLIAVIVNLVCRLPFTWTTQRVFRRRSQINPLLQAWQIKILQDLKRENRTRHMGETEISKATLSRLKPVMNRIYARLGLQEWKLYTSPMAVPVWVFVMDGIRRISGVKSSLLASWMTRGKAAPTDVEVAATPVREALTPPTSMLNSASGSAVVGPPESIVDGVASSATNVANAAVSSSIEPTLLTEGALWFQDLTAADPYHVLPLALSAVLVLNIFPQNSAGKQALFGISARSSSTDPTVPIAPLVLSPGYQSKRALYRGLFLLSLLIGPLTMHLPAALHLYWVSSASASWAIQRIVKRAMPVTELKVERPLGNEASVIRPKGHEEGVSGNSTRKIDSRKKL